MLRYLTFAAALVLLVGCGGDTKVTSPDNPLDTPANLDASGTDGGATEEKIDL